MGMTNAEKRKQAKKKARERRIRKMVNLRRNCATPEFVLDVRFGSEWKKVRTFNSSEAVNAHVKETEKCRAEGQEILPGRVSSLKTGRTVLEIVGSKAKGMAPDKFAG